MGAFFKSFWNDTSTFKQVVRGMLAAGAFWATAKGHGDTYGALLGGLAGGIPSGTDSTMLPK